MQKNYDPRIAQLRGFASFSVALYHLWTLQLVPLLLFRPGWLGVPLFFELSIFLLLQRLDVNSNMKKYFARRIKRIYPLYYLSATAVFLVELYYFHDHVTIYELFLHYVFLSSVLAPFSFQYLFWSLQLEEWMYLFIPLIHRLSDMSKFLLAVGLILSSFIYGAFIVTLPYNEFHLLYFMPPFWLSAYGWGIIAYILYRNNTKLCSTRSAISFLFLIYVMYLLAPSGNELLYELTTRVVVYNMALVVFMLIILNPPKVLSKVSVFLGEISYGIYVWHLLMEELLGVVGILLGIVVAFATEFPLRRKEILLRLREFG
ncbi:putative acyltransferase family archaeal protein [Acidianus two-tailed virus 2]|nr:putative acyltransferase family archaeal protein [Acidianus two-tailed virus 2]